MRCTLLAALTICLILSSACSRFDRNESGTACESVPSGRSDLPRILVFGEIHGTAEAPRFVADWICNLARSSPVIVGIEHPSSEQAALDSFMSTKALEPARGILVESSFWTRDSQDGRTSIAMYAMLDRLRELRQSGADVTVVAVGSSGFGGGDEITDNLQALSRYSNAKIVTLLGNAHARKAGAEGRDGVSRQMFDEPYRALAFTHSGGTAWACAPVCEVQDLGLARQGPHRIGEIVIDDTSIMYDGFVHLGVVHASTPARDRWASCSMSTDNREC
ncbi:hypothetical protein EDF74_3229 [Stenotrophomonas rhizophila]|uniref:hypothetical protein n=1 Tax=Stenotrophomonas rhizophila TaxID=216778 RepID=UPI000F4B19B6|nr:hypothetical protein [Stenotrophomonas rhizophila]ROP73794.1 hypothetical protein EDF74_3229 [Stenotrophomonas rhizophila]